MGFRVVPVVDLKGGMAVHAVGGRRDQYQPLRSVWQGSPSPVGLAASLRAGLGIDRLYVADLDAIEGRRPDAGLYERLASEGLEIWLDAGVKDRQAAGSLLEIAPDRLRIVVGLESVRGPEALGGIIEHAGPGRVIFSVDMDAGRPRIAPGASWATVEPLEIAARSIELGVPRVILLDLSRVGRDAGTGTEVPLAQLRARYPEIALVVGGGIRGIDDVIRLRGHGASEVLVGSAIHDGRMGRRDLDRIAETSG